MGKSAQPANSAPLSEATYLILLSLAAGAKHGYAILKDVELLSEGRTMLSTGTLYGALSRMLEQGWIERREDADGESGGPPKKTYALTGQGRGVVEAELRRMQTLVAAAAMRLSGGHV